MIILGIDLGDAHTGIAKLDTKYPIAIPLETIHTTNLQALASDICAVASREKAERLVLGLPVNMNGSPGPRAEKTKKFGETISQISGLPVYYFDERLTSSYADRVFNMTDTRGKKRKETVDAVAATVILQGYADALRNKNVQDCGE